MAQRFYIGVVHRAQVARARELGVVAFSHGRESAVRGLAAGDAVIFYSPKTDFDGEPVQAFTGHAVVTGDAPRPIEFLPGHEGWVRDATFDAVVEVPVRPFLDRLSFVRNPRHWGMSFRQGKFAIPEPDYRQIAAALMPGDAAR